ncbi:MAG: MerR family transcriptional regulator [Azonexus sp.]|nr:MerR family transcriptional regulator [Azonexus sp.]
MSILNIVRATDLERETGLGKDLLRKWRSRYGFPVPFKESGSEQGYAREQVAQLRLIKRLLDGGFRPGHIVGKSHEQLEQLIPTLACNAESALPSASTMEALDYLKQHDLQGLDRFLERERSRQSLTDFVELTVAPLAVDLGKAWAKGEIAVYQEHLCTSALVQHLFREIGSVQPKAGFPRIIFATPSEEFHVLGLLMAQAVLADHGAHCISIGPQIPLGDLNLAARGCSADIVAMSFSFAYPKHRIRPLLEQLRQILPEAVEIWAGGAGAATIKRAIKGVRVFSDLREAAKALHGRVEEMAA